MSSNHFTSAVLMFSKAQSLQLRTTRCHDRGGFLFPKHWSATSDLRDMGAMWGENLGYAIQEASKIT
jgi:hypothetical protein